MIKAIIKEKENLISVDLYNNRDLISMSFCDKIEIEQSKTNNYYIIWLYKAYYGVTCIYPQTYEYIKEEDK